MQWFCSFIIKNYYIYKYKDHLGNARISFAKDSAGALEVTDTNNYYAFGMNHVGGIKSLLGGYLNYKYNGKELQESGMYDYGARFYMPDIGRWGVVDPLAEKMTRHSPYNYAFNNPLRFVDPDGRQNEDIIITGANANKAFEQLKNSSKNLNLQMDANGKVTGTAKEGAQLTEADQKLLYAMNKDSQHIAVINATDATEYNGKAIVGDKFLGSTVLEDGSVIGKQIVNTEALAAIDKVTQVEGGVGMLHATLEAYVGAVDSPGSGEAEMGKSNPGYKAAHHKMQSIDPRHVDKFGVKVIEKEYNSKTGRGTIDLYVTKDGREEFMSTNKNVKRK